MFAGTGSNITTEGRKHLGASLGSRAYLEDYVGSKVEDWVAKVSRLSEFAKSQPQACYAVFTFGLRHRWTCFMRTLPDIGNLMEPSERAISELLIPSTTERNCSQVERDLVALPARMGGLGLTNPSEIAESEYSASIMLTRPLVDQIVAQSHQSPIQNVIRNFERCTALLQSVVRTLQQHAQKTKDDDLRERLTELQNSLPEKIQRALEITNEKGASSWLTDCAMTGRFLTVHQYACAVPVSL